MDIIQKRIDRINHLLNRLDELPEELDSIHEILCERSLTRKEFADLITLRRNLMIEQANKKRELEEEYRLRDWEWAYMREYRTGVIA